ncbi:hypothetical protein EPYR_03767 [Erwinia pyrifoliae DSM 12163]|nr:hypothetical protein EPYR_03767 [Erwinia pyrifoliae DSM 12163]
MQPGGKAQQNMPFMASWVGKITAAVIHSSRPRITPLQGAPKSHAGFARMFCHRHFRPARGSKGDIARSHRRLFISC